MKNLFDQSRSWEPCKYTMEMFVEPALNVYNYVDDGFVKIADVGMEAMARYYRDPTVWYWKLINQNEEFLLYYL